MSDDYERQRVRKGVTEKNRVNAEQQKPVLMSDTDQTHYLGNDGNLHLDYTQVNQNKTTQTDIVLVKISIIFYGYIYIPDSQGKRAQVYTRLIKIGAFLTASLSSRKSPITVKSSSDILLPST
jgi:hypothetical protein